MRVLLVEDEPYLANSLTKYLNNDGFIVDSVSTIRESHKALFSEVFDIVLLDLNLPDGDGLSLLEEIRSEYPRTAIIILTARGEVEDRVKGLNLGSDDYISKPFSMLELSARINAVIRRKFGLKNNRVDLDGLSVHLDEMLVKAEDQPLSVTKIEYNILRYLALNRGKTVSRISLAEHIWGNEVDDRFSLDFINSHIKNIRKKLKDTGREQLIKTIYGVGYRIDKT
jgi:DNA-binding response OmpR family regulator